MIIVVYFLILIILAVSFNARFYALNLLINMFNKDWNKMITDSQVCILQFLEKYMISNAPVVV